MPAFSRFAPALLAVVTLALPALAAPIRVALFKGEGGNRFWHTATHTAGSSIARLLTAPAQVQNLGPTPIIPSAGFQVEFAGLANGQGSPTNIQASAFIGSLDSLDVVVFINTVNIHQIFPDSAQRAKLEAFSRTRGIVALHATSDYFVPGDSSQHWSGWNALMGTNFLNHPASDRNATLRLDTAARHDASWRLLNHGLPDTARFVEEWLSFQDSGAALRAQPGLKVTVHIDENSYEGGLGGAVGMGDHPMSWYRELPQGGRFFYTALGHRAANYDSLGPTYFVRRQIYNAILWAAKVDSTGVVPLQRAPSRAPSSFEARVVGNFVRVRISDARTQRVEVQDASGRRIAARRISGTTDLAVPGPGLYIVTLSSVQGRLSRKVVVP